jgi:uncharacterized membrane protein
MSAVRHFIRQPAPSQQRGVMTLTLAALMLAITAFLALSVDTGRLFLEKRTLQRQADLAALETSLAYCRDQSLDDDGIFAAAQAALASERNNFRGDAGGIAVVLGEITSADDGNGGSVKQFTASADGKAVQVTLTRTIRASLFGSVVPGGNQTITIEAQGAAEACQPVASLHLRSNLLNVDSSQSALLNGVLGGLLGTTLNLSVAQWDGLLDTNLNLLSYLDALAIDLGISAGDYDSVLNADVSLGNLLDVGADVLELGGNTAAVSAFRDLVLAIPGATPLISLGELLEVQTGAPDAALDIGLQAMQLVQGTIQLANSKSAIAADIPINLLGLAGATVKLQVTDPPRLMATGNPKLATDAPYGADAIFVRSAQVRTFISLDLPIVGATLNTLLSLVNDNPLLNGIAGTVSSLLSLDILGVLQGLSCVVYCDIQRDLLDIEVLSSPRLDILLEAGSGDGRVTDYDCDGEDKALDALANSSAVSVLAGSLGSDMNDAATNAFDEASPNIEPIPILDIGTKRVRYQCTLLLICWTEYWDGSAWDGDPSSAERDAFSGGGLGLSLDSDLLAGSETLNFANNPSDDYLPEFGVDPIDEAYQSVDTQSLVDNLEGDLLGLNLEFYAPTNSGDGITGNTLGGLLFLVGSAANALTGAIEAIITSTLSPLLTAIVNQLLDALGVSLAETEIGAAMTCESDRVKLVM